MIHMKPGYQDDQHMDLVVEKFRTLKPGDFRGIQIDLHDNRAQFKAWFSKP